MSEPTSRRPAGKIRIRSTRRSGIRHPAALHEIVSERKQAESGATPGLDIGPFRITYSIALGFILLVAIWFRFVNLDWDNGLYLHPDERFLAQVVSEIAWPHDIRQYFDSATSPLNPFNGRFTNYVYGTFPIFLDKFAGSLFGQTVYGNAHIPGRILSALEDLAALLFAAWAARMLFGRAVSLLTAALFACSVMNIQAAHFMTTDSASTLFAIAAFALAIKAGQSRRVGWFALAGLMVGLAAASKPNLLLTAGFLGLPALEMVRIHGWDALLPGAFRPYASQRIDRDRWPVVVSTLAGVVVAALSFRIFQPYAFLGPNPWDFRLDPRWTATLDYWRKAQAGIIDMPPGIQWADRTPFEFLLKNFILRGTGPALGLACLAGWAVLVVQVIRMRRWPSWWVLGLLGWIGFHLVFYGGAFNQVQRYLLPAYPFMFITGAWLLVRLWNWARSGRMTIPRWPRWLHPGFVLPVVVVGSTLFYAAAFANSVYLHPHTRIEASEWIYDNLPVGSTLTNEHWDDALPLRLPDRDASVFRGVQLELYNTDNEQKLTELVNQLDRADYIITSSNRLYGSIPRMPYRYPMATAYYEALFNGDLGFDLIKTFEHPPELFGITFDDQNADESFTVYDHPKVMIFQKTDRWSANKTWLYLDNALGDGGINLRPIDVTPEQVMLSPDDVAEYSTAGTWSSLFDRDSFINKLPALWWYLLLQALALPAIPILWRILPTLPDRGYALAKLVGMLGTTYLAWLLASYHIARFSPGGIALCWLLLCLAGVVAVNVRYREFLDSLIQRWRWIVVSEAIFLGGYLFFLWLRWLNPDLWHPARGGEKPMDFAFFNAIIKSDYFPPYDPWFAGGALHYYYWGFIPWAAMTKVSGIVPEVAYNLAIPSLFALLLLLVWNAAAIVIARMRAAWSDPTRGWSALAMALVAPLFVGLLGNLDFARRIGRGEWGYPPMPGSLERFSGVGEIAHGIWNALTASRSLPPDAYWPSTRVIPNTINEFPYFSFLYADLHAHVMSMPIVAGSLVVAIAIAGLAPATSPSVRPFPLYSLGGWRTAVPIAILAGFVSGILVASNTWDYPPALALIGAATLIASGTSTGWRLPWVSLRDTAIFGAIVYVTGQVLLFPYLSRYGSLPSQLEPAGETTRIADYVTVNGLMLFAIGGFLLVELWTLTKALRQYGIAGWFTIAMMLLVGVCGLAIALATDLTSILIVLVIAAIGLCALNRHLSPVHLLVFAIIALALGLTLFPERFRLANDVGRMNTVFKFYLHAWILLGVGATIAIAQVFTRTPPATWSAPEAKTEQEAQVTHTGWGGWIASRVWLAGLAFLVLAASMYPALATGPRLDDRFNDIPPTLNGLAFMDEAVQAEGAENQPAVRFTLAGDHAAITWLQDNVQGTPVILEAVQPQYHWAGRVSVQTGLPAVLGWEWHETQQRPGYESWIQQRKTDVAYMYSADAPFSAIQPLLDKYKVRLIYVGDLERAIYPEIGLAKFAQAADQGLLTIVYQTESTVIYAYPAETEAGTS